MKIKQATVDKYGVFSNITQSFFLINFTRINNSLVILPIRFSNIANSI